MSDSRVWLITGTSTGIGRALVKEVIAAGERVAAITRKASRVSTPFAAFPTDKLLVVEYDIGNPSHSAELLFENIHKHFGRIDVVVNNAGYALNSVVEGASDEDAHYQFEVNFWGPVRISREAVKYFRENKIPAGRVLNISSIAGFNAIPSVTFYCASKSALDKFSEGLHKELSPEWNIKVIVIQLGGVRTEWQDSRVDQPLPPAYDTPDSAPNKIRSSFKSTIFPSDPVKVSLALINVSREANPPLILPLGPDSQSRILNKLDQIRKELEQWNKLTLSSVADGVDSSELEETTRDFAATFLQQRP